jgi:hypothetical protein
MSMQLVVFARQSPPDVGEWEAVAAANGLALKFEGPFDTVSHNGAVRLTCEGVEAAFEYYNDTIREYLSEVGHQFSWLRRWRLSLRPRAIQFVTHSRTDDWMAASVAASACSALTGGLLLDTTTGRFMSSAAVWDWARERAAKLVPRNVSQRSAISTNVHTFIESVLTERGFARTERLRLVTGRDAGAGERWYDRRGRTLPNELVQVETYFDGEDAFATITFFGTTNDLDLLRAGGVIGNAAGRELFMFLWGTLQRDPSSLLPSNIPIGDGLASTAIGKRLRAEVGEADELIWTTLAADWHDLQREERLSPP